MRVRRADPEDSEALGRAMKIVADEGRWLATEAGAPVEGLIEMFQTGFEAGNVFFALEEEGELVGALGLHPGSAAGVYQLGMWILSAHRGQGGGRMLIEAGLGARPADVHKIELEVFPDNEAAIALYESVGFEPEGLRREHYRRRDGSLRSSLLMARLFANPS